MDTRSTEEIKIDLCYFREYPYYRVASQVKVHGVSGAIEALGALQIGLLSAGAYVDVECSKTKKRCLEDLPPSELTSHRDDRLAVTELCG